MSSTPKSASEKDFQENFVKELEKYKWKAVEELNGNTHKVTVDDLIAFWRKELKRNDGGAQDEKKNIYTLVCYFYIGSRMWRKKYRRSK